VAFFPDLEGSCAKSTSVLLDYPNAAFPRCRGRESMASSLQKTLRRFLTTSAFSCSRWRSCPRKLMTRSTPLSWQRSNRGFFSAFAQFCSIRPARWIIYGYCPRQVIIDNNRASCSDLHQNIGCTKSSWFLSGEMRSRFPLLTRLFVQAQFGWVFWLTRYPESLAMFLAAKSVEQVRTVSANWVKINIVRGEFVLAV